MWCPAVVRAHLANGHGGGRGAQADREKRRREEEEQQRRMDELAARQRAREEEIEKRLREEKAAALAQPPIRAEAPPAERQERQQERQERPSRPAPSSGGEFPLGRRAWQQDHSSAALRTCITHAIVSAAAHAAVMPLQMVCCMSCALLHAARERPCSFSRRHLPVPAGAVLVLRRATPAARHPPTDQRCTVSQALAAAATCPPREDRWGGAGGRGGDRDTREPAEGCALHLSCSSAVAYTCMCLHLLTSAWGRLLSLGTNQRHAHSFLGDFSR
jgi:hypothetical protein